MARKCLISAHIRNARCDTCERYATPVHIPTTVAGIFCEKHCPVCSALDTDKPDEESENSDAQNFLCEQTE